MSLSKDYKTGLIVVGIFFSILIVGLIRNKAAKNRTKKSHEIRCATLTNVYWRKGNPYCELKFLYKGKEIRYPDKFYNDLGIRKEAYRKFNDGDSNVLVIFPPDDPGNLFLLENKEDFERFGVTAKDTIGLLCY